MARKRTITNYFPFSTPAGFFMDYWAGALHAKDLIIPLIDAYNEEGGESIIDLDHMGNFTGTELLAIQSIYREVSDMERELTAKTMELEHEKPIGILYFYVPSYTNPDSTGGFTLCALTQVNNNGQVNIFAPEREYLTVYGGDIREW